MENQELTLTAEDLLRVGRLIESEMLTTALPLEATLIAGGRSNPTYVIRSAEHEWILRRPPYGHVLPTAHDMNREYRVLTALEGTRVPVPRARLLCEDTSIIGAPFYLMDRLSGVTFRTPEDVTAYSDEQLARYSDALVATLGALHEVQPQDAGLGDLGNPDGYLRRQLLRWREQWRKSMTTERPAVDRLLDVLEANVPPLRYPGIVHGDYKCDNVMVNANDPSRVLGVLDWEMSTLGDTLADLGLLLSFWDEPGEVPHPIGGGLTASSGFPNRRRVIETYAQQTGRDPADVDWYVVLAYVKVAIILEGIHRRRDAGLTAGAVIEDVSQMIQPLLDRASESADKSDLKQLRKH